MIENTLKIIIQKYIILKINSREWSKNQIILSENQIAMKFHCSRITARKAMQNLVYTGFLLSVKGKGYVVVEKKKIYQILKLKKQIKNF